MEFTSRNDSYETKGTFLSIEGEERDTVYLLFGDLKSYISSEIEEGSSLFDFLYKSSSVVIPAGLVCLAFLNVMRVSTGSAQLRIKALGDPNIAHKLDYLISKSVSPIAPLLILFAAMIVPMLFLTANPIRPLAKKMEMTNVFLLGKQVLIHQKRKKLISNIFWVVFIGAAVSIVTGLCVWYVTK
ncbi:hypothetical protein [Xanthomonas arboricola]|uniref:hypothetical protein n=1 Tax=Xanthomonas arboricola TaxID=56448 RepID=UPI001AF95108|nr:hypothetical protein [Xanthomonas arboricola]CAD7380678.1 hypothetical protein X12_001983 [Xanthomonas arboricola]CAG2089563.1 hypothetical protein XCY_001982 [Xanthomonas arboricola pv. juglandis]